MSRARARFAGRRRPMRECPGHHRHWFTYYGDPGTSAPYCQRCGQANPNYDPTRDPEKT